MATYNTHQKKNLINFLKAHADQSFSIDDIAEKMKEDPSYENPPGKSTVYRLMPKLVLDGTVTCFTESISGKTSYQIIGDECCHHHMHMKCTGCGMLIHMSDEDSAKLTNQIRTKSHFNIDLSRTLLFGLCESCGSKGGVL